MLRRPVDCTMVESLQRRNATQTGIRPARFRARQNVNGQTSSYEGGERHRLASNWWICVQPRCTMILIAPHRSPPLWRRHLDDARRKTRCGATLVRKHSDWRITRCRVKPVIWVHCRRSARSITVTASKKTTVAVQIRAWRSRTSGP